MITEKLAASQHMISDLAAVQTNILSFHPSPDPPTTPAVVARARECGLLVFAFGPRTTRTVTHLDVSKEQWNRSADIFLEIVDRPVR